MLAAFFGLVRVVNTSSMALLYSGLDSNTSSEIVASLEQQSVPFEIRGDAVYVDSNQRDRVRLSLAGEGLPSSGISGYELLDSLSGFGTTSQMFDAAYWRAKEGELARTILASARISMARVHIANAVQQPFSKGVETSASVTVTAKNGVLVAGQAEAIRHLVAAAVTGLAPEQVAVIDSEYGVILQPGKANAQSIGANVLDSRAEALRENIERLLTARVGAGNAVVEVMLEANTESETVTERILDPAGSVPISSDSESISESSTGGGGGAVTVASNLPDTGDSASSGQNSSNQSQSRERINYEISETVRERVQVPGDIARLSVAVLLNFETAVAPNGEVLIAPRTEQEIAAFQTLVQSVVGFNAARGDVVTIETMQFPTPEIMGTTAAAGFLSGYIFDVPSMLQIAVLAIVTIMLGMFVVKPILVNPPPHSKQLALEPIDAIGEAGDFASAGALPNLTEGAAQETPPKDPIEILRDTIALRSEDRDTFCATGLKQIPKNRKNRSHNGVN